MEKYIFCILYSSLCIMYSLQYTLSFTAYHTKHHSRNIYSGFHKISKFANKNKQRSTDWRYKETLFSFCFKLSPFIYLQIIFFEKLSSYW